MRVTSTQAKSPFDELYAQAKREPAFLGKARRLDTVMLSAEWHQAVQARHCQASRTGPMKAFEAELGDGIAVHHARAGRQDIPYAAAIQIDLLDALAWAPRTVNISPPL